MRSGRARPKRTQSLALPGLARPPPVRAASRPCKRAKPACTKAKGSAVCTKVELMPPPVHRHCASKALEATHSVKEESRSTLLVMSIAQRHATKQEPA